jgi:hypothetical protein
LPYQKNKKIESIFLVKVSRSSGVAQNLGAKLGLLGLSTGIVAPKSLTTKEKSWV